MNFLISFFVSILLAGTIVAQPLVPSLKPTADSAAVYAVIVGISSYQDPAIDQLQYANADAIAFAGFLKSKAGGGVPAKNIQLLTDSNATQAAVILAINWLVRVAKKNDLVYFYFSGHGNVENVTMFNKAHLICYNTLRDIFEGMSLSVEKLNDNANTLSATNGANVVIITDACHSGKIASANAEKNQLIGEQLLASNEKEIRIASCQPDQLSNENEKWGGGRGVFSYYLVNGLKGLADKNENGIVTLGELKLFLNNKMNNDRVLLNEHKIQTPVLKGADDAFQLSTIDINEARVTRNQDIADSLSNTIVLSSNPVNIEWANDEAPDDYFFRLLKNENLETLTDSLHLDKIKPGEIALSLIDWVSQSIKDENGLKKLKALKNDLLDNAESLIHFKENLVRALDDQVQNAINLYLSGDEAELEKRRYYNSRISNYNVYLKMLTAASRLIPENNFYYNILQLKLHYFSGVVYRIKIPLYENHDSLISLALVEQQKALLLQPDAAYILNELGLLFSLKNQDAEAEKYFIKATQHKNNWAIPWANLAGLYAQTKQFAKGFEANNKADSLQKGLQSITINSGILNERSGNLLYAEEDYRKAIDINSRHYLPFERLAYVYLNTTNYAASDSFFYEADLRKKGFHFEGHFSFIDQDKQLISPQGRPLCEIDTSLIKKNDLLAFFTLGVQEYEKQYWGLEKSPFDLANGLDGLYHASEYYPFDSKKNKDYSLAIYYLKKVIAIDKKNPLVYYYLGKIYFAQKQWEKAELMFNYAMENYLDKKSFDAYYTNLIKKSSFPYDHSCFEIFFQNSFYDKMENYYFLASLLENWKHVDEAEQYYKKIIAENPDSVQAYIKLWQLLEKQDRYNEAEYLIRSLTRYNKNITDKELNAFYRRAINRHPQTAEWPYKLGLFLYDLAERPSLNCKTDTIIWFPKINKEIFLGADGYAGSNEDLLEDEGPGVSNTGCNVAYTVHADNLKEIYMPATGEKLYLNGAIYYPRYDGIKFLKEAAKLIASREMLAEINYKIGMLYIWAGSKKQAYPYFVKSLEFVPNNANTRMEIVEVGSATFKNRAALEQLIYLYDSSQINFKNRLLFSQFAMYAGQFARSKKILDEAEAVNPYPLPEISELWGRLNLLSNNPEQAISFYKVYLKDKPGDAGVYYTLARLYAMQKKNKEALSSLDIAVKLGFNYGFILKTDPVMDKLRNTNEWNLVTKNIKPKIWIRRNNSALDGNH